MLTIDSDQLNIIKAANRLVEDVYKKYPLFLEANKLVEDCKTMERFQSDELIRVAGKLSAITASLGDVISRATARANSAYLYRKFSLRWNFSTLSKELPKYERENTAEKMTEKNHTEEMVIRCAVDTLKTRFESYTRTISLIQSRMGILKNEMYSATLGNEESQRRV